MPFIDQSRREMIADGTIDYTDQPGDRCYIHYKQMVDSWRANPRWTTAHQIFKAVVLRGTQFGVNDDSIARELAWQVFFQLYVMPYELHKREVNGDI